MQSGSVLSRLAAGALLVLLLLAGYQILIRPVLERHQDNRATIADSRNLLERYQQLAAKRETFADHLAAMEQARRESTGYIDAVSDALAAAAIQDHVAETIASASGEIKSLQVLPADEIDGQPAMRRIGLKLRFAATLNGLAIALRELESAKLSLFVDKLVVTAPNGGISSADAAREPPLDIRLEIFGYARDQGRGSAGHDTSGMPHRFQGLHTEIQPGQRAQVQFRAVNATAAGDP